MDSQEEASKSLEATEQKFRKELDIFQMKNFILFQQNPESKLSSLKKLLFSADFFPRYNDINWEFHTILGNFLSLVASQLEDLRIEVGESNELRFDEDCYNKINGFDRLHVLVTEVKRGCRCHDTKRGRFIFVPNFIGKILQKSPVLRKLSILWSSTFQLNWPNLGDKVLRSIPESVEFLHMVIRFAENDYGIFGSLSLPNLTSLYLTLYCNIEIRGSHVYNLFSNSKNNTLLKLNLAIQSTTCHGSITGFRLPIFPNLISFTFGAEIRVAIDHEVDMSFPILLPKVTELETSDNYLQVLFPLGNGIIAPHVKTCTLNINSEYLHDVFTGLTRLIVVVGHDNHELDSLRMIFTEQKSLEHLELVFEKARFPIPPQQILNVDSLLTGIPIPVCETIQDSPNWTEVLISTIKQSPGISDLTKLKTLAIRSRIPAVHITDVTAYLGILQIPELVKLRIDKFMMSETCIANLKLKFGVGFVYGHNRRN